MRERAEARLRGRFPALTRCNVRVEQLPYGPCAAHLELRAPQHQIIVNEEGSDTESALERALETVSRRLEEAAHRDPRLRQMR